MAHLERRLLVAFLVFLPLLSVRCVSKQKTKVSWCVLSDAEEQKCLDLAGNATARNIRGTLQCIRGLSTRDCMDKIKNGTADATSISADDIYAAGLCHGLELAAGESYNRVDGISYYVVVIARRSSSDLSLLEMHERSSCHPGIRTTVGWTVPIGYLVNTSQISVGEQCNFPRAVGNFFGYSCVPGVKDPQHDPRGNNPKNLCEACIGDENDRHICANNHKERHYGEAGALRCVAENLGDVAFVKHTTVFANLDGKNQESWALDLELEDLKLLCPDGTEAGLDEYERCHLAAVPANAVVVRMEDKCRVWKYLERLQNVFGNATEGFSLFSSAGYGESNLLFSDATHHLQRVLGSYTSWLGPTYTTMLQAFECEAVLIIALSLQQASADGTGGRNPEHQLPPHPSVCVPPFCLSSLPSVSHSLTMSLAFSSVSILVLFQPITSSNILTGRDNAGYYFFIARNIVMDAFQSGPALMRSAWTLAQSVSTLLIITHDCCDLVPTPRQLELRLRTISCKKME
ncbi:Otolith matrix protein 1 [Channa argus]|uniref:Serotransferrin n=1 Tax=Channa argus TaxID=215402 RepID=A0A6G1QG02_CHAAH|nr:Otolith matrix protein 1 [Channa argus]